MPVCRIIGLGSKDAEADETPLLVDEAIEAPNDENEKGLLLLIIRPLLLLLLLLLLDEVEEADEYCAKFKPLLSELKPPAVLPITPVTFDLTWLC